ncbi:DUF397 domain-containing protein [Nocardiopsis gilva YIM 90087]|uniref:DUF397 domain-containing protein n=1 Tax=Nocardiopsis gilva YIM 90087 TaxID=1235441 RepID=A0A223S5R5_9ACTN|nr:DUF397 domain-containing protein [Nocardiopsis gilva]ASU83458.1 DUF397 domain-containing protein [Nocardiopsis gilva YIM 90087]
MSHETLTDLVFQKSSYSNPGECVEVAPLSCGGRAVRDSKSPVGLIQRFPVVEWSRFIRAVKSGEFSA